MTDSWFQSYQSKQINPDNAGFDTSDGSNTVSIVSIQTDQSRPKLNKLKGKVKKKFQSYQSKQINPDSVMGPRLWFL